MNVEEEVKKHLGLVHYCINLKYKIAVKKSQFEYDDLFQIGMIGLYRAITTFDNTTEFSVYACRHIMNEIGNELRKVMRIKRGGDSKPYSLNGLDKNTGIEYIEFLQDNLTCFGRKEELDIVDKIIAKDIINDIMSSDNEEEKTLLLFLTRQIPLKEVRRVFNCNQPYTTVLKNKFIDELRYRYKLRKEINPQVFK